ncbi:diguanylate cyclase [Prevotella herbatica]|uniref:Diguanylate cyclase n=1 Tax=Prevotella herbatica TaxID=2801997 RepID=A0ABN6EJS7_9BACT|nr:nitroreductase [Prevotella herbatica]BCS84981.1 diguanylate cyclase [Prevotella herbatica]
MDNEVLKAIRERRSIRRFKPEQIHDEELKTILEAGTWAATGKGKQDSWIVAVQNKETCDKLRRMNAKVMETEADPYYGAPTIIIVFGSADWRNNIKDGSLVIGNMMLAAHSIGLASCWINREDTMFETEEGKQLLKDWELPDDIVGIGAISLGYASAHPHIVKPRKENYYRIIK